MTGDKQQGTQNQQKWNDLSRREFVALSLAAGITAAAGMAPASVAEVVETDVDVKTADGMCDAVFIHPAKGTHPEPRGGSTQPDRAEHRECETEATAPVRDS